MGTNVGLGGVPPKAEWIRQHLLEKGREGDFTYHMWKNYVTFYEAAKKLGVRIRPGPYTGFRTFMYVLRKHGLIEFVREAPIRAYFDRRYYRIVPAKIKDPRWRRPIQTAYPITDWKRKTREEKTRRRAEWRARRKKLPRGRPRGSYQSKKKA